MNLARRPSRAALAASSVPPEEFDWHAGSGTKVGAGVYPHSAKPLIAIADATGIVSTSATWIDKMMVKEIEATLGEDLPHCTVPGVAPYVEMKPRVSLGARKSTLKVKRR